MNFMILLKKAPIVFLLLLFVVISSVEAERIRVRRVKTQIAPRHISLSAKSGNGIYARRYAYGRPLTGYSTKGTFGKNRRNYGGVKRRRVGKRSRTYANKWTNWTPNRNYPGGKNNPRVDKINPKKRKELLPLLLDPGFNGKNPKRRIRPQRFNPMQRPQPPKKTNEFDDDYFFPEEAKRAETKYEFENRYPRPKKKRRNPGDLEQPYKKPDLGPKIPFYDEKPLGYKPKYRDPPVSYSTFIQHTPGSQDYPEDFYEDPDGPAYSKPVRNKKKRVKKKPNSKKKNKDEDHYRPFVFENDQKHESYPPYVTDDYELPSKTTKKRNKPSYDFSQDEEFAPTKNTLYSKPRPSSVFSADSDYRGGQNAQFNPTYSQSWSSVVETTARPVQYQTENGFQPQYIPNYNRDYSSVQKTKTVSSNAQTTYYSQPDNTYKNVAYNNNYVSNQVSSTNSQVPNYNGYSQPAATYSQSGSSTYSQPASPTYSQPAYSQPASPSYSQPASPTYSQPVSSGSTLTDITIQKSVPIYDNTETFYNYNNNAYVNSQSSKYYDPDGKYGNKLSSSYREKTDSDSDFIKKHQNLYNNGLSGVPIQGDGYAKETLKKDYDIGYGDFQFDENPGT